jgi:hypothetical protein
MNIGEAMTGRRSAENRAGRGIWRPFKRAVKLLLARPACLSSATWGIAFAGQLANGDPATIHAGSGEEFTT